MPRWYALCQGAGQPPCPLCRRYVGNNGSAAEDPRQGFTSPAFVGQHCNNFIERPAYTTAAITPTDTRG